MIAEIPPVEWSTTGNVMLGIIGILGVCVLILSFVEKWKKVFGKHPPLHEEIEKLRSDVKISVAGAYKAVEKERLTREQAFQDLALERARTVQTINESVLQISKDIAFMRGQMSRLERK